MKRVAIFVTLLFSLFLATNVSAQDSGKSDSKDEGKDLLQTALDRDADHNLDVAWQYFKLKKAYRSALGRLDETIIAHPTYSKMDEVLYLAGMSSYYLLNKKGKQKLNYKLMSDAEKKRFSPEKLEEDANLYLGMLIENHPDSKHVKDAKKYLAKLEKKK